MILFSIDNFKKHEKEHKSEENDFMNEHEGKIYEEKNAKMFGCVMWIQRTKETQEKSFRQTIQLLKMWQNV